MKNTVNSNISNIAFLDDMESALVNAQIDLIMHYIDVNESIQSKFMAKYGYENEDLLKEHDELVDELQSLCEKRRSM